MKSSSKTDQIGIAVVGSGYWGKNLIRNFYQLEALTLICDKNDTVLENFKAQYPRVETCVAFSEIIQREDIDAVAIATPAETHFRLAQEALLAEKHVFVEKPLALHERDGEELIALAEEKNRVLMIGHLLQYHPVFVRLKEIASAGEIGRINYIYSHRLNLGKIRREENILWSFAPHDISMILTLAGEEPVSVITTGGNYLHQRIADVTTTHLDFSSGLKAHIFVSWLHPFKEQKLVVVGDRKMAVFDDTLPWEEKLLLYPHKIKWQNNMPIPDKADPERLDIPQDEPLRLECRHFLETIRNGTEALTEGREGLRVLKVLNAGQESLYKNGDKVFLTNAGGTQTAIERELISISNDRKPADSQKSDVHPTAVVDENVHIGAGTKIWHFSHILSGSKVGGQCNIGQNVVIGPDVAIGNRCKIQNNVNVFKGVTLDDYVFCGPSMVFTNVFNPRAEFPKMDQVRPTLVKRGVTIGANATIICGVTLGKYCFIGAGAVVTKDVPDHALVIGNPARHAGWVCGCGETVSKDLVCHTCGKKYKKQGKGLVEIS
jgi:UDP-2-acetamido-3-amino-2,3-dideoxy-glucuronate N-acetyltransferase